MKHLILPLMLIIIAACAPTTQDAQGGHWSDTTLTDVATGEEYTLSQFENPVFIESFAVWCPTCTEQQRELDEYHEQNPAVTSVSLNTDPNEDAHNVQEHIERHGFDWRFSISPPNLTRALIDEFGNTVVNAPSTPVILLCPNGDASMLASGIKRSEELAQAVATCEAA